MFPALALATWKKKKKKIKATKSKLGIANVTPPKSDVVRRTVQKPERPCSQMLQTMRMPRGLEECITHRKAPRSCPPSAEPLWTEAPPANPLAGVAPHGFLGYHQDTHPY